MDQTKVTIVGIIALASMFLAVLGYRFVADHWEDIKTLAILGLILGGTFSMAVGGLKLRSGK